MKLAVLLTVAIVCFVTAAHAADAVRRPCLSDRDRFCPDAQPGPDLVSCLTQHKAELSEACREAMGSRMARSRPFDAGGPCEDDRAKFCGDVEQGGGAVARCLREHEAELSPACKERMAGAKRAARTGGACREDIGKLCKDVQPGGGRVMDCLRSHESELSAACKEALAARSSKP